MQRISSAFKPGKCHYFLPKPPCEKRFFAYWVTKSVQAAKVAQEVYVYCSKACDSMRTITMRATKACNIEKREHQRKETVLEH